MSFITEMPYPSEECSICMNSLDSDVWSHQSHRFHGRCLKDWLKVSPTCPLCRKEVNTTLLLSIDVMKRMELRRSPTFRYGMVCLFICTVLTLAPTPSSEIIKVIYQLGFSILLIGGLLAVTPEIA